MNSDGVGLGLHISRSIVKLNGGKISAHSEGIGKGSTFIFSFAARVANKLPGYSPEIAMDRESYRDLDESAQPRPPGES